MNKRFTILMLLMVLFVPWAAKAQETKMVQVAPDRGGNRGTMTVYKRVSSPTSGRNYLIVSSATANSDALALSQTSSTDANITAAFVHINSGISATGNAAYIANLADPTAVWKATSGWTFSHTKNGTNYYLYTSSTYSSAGSLSANTTATNWDWSNNQLSYTASLLGFLTSTYYLTPSSTGFSIGSSAANVYLYEETSVTAYNVTASVSPAGIGRVTGDGQYPSGATCTLTASTTNSEYAFSNWTVNGTVVSTSPTFNFTVSEDFDVVANFESSVTCPSPTNLTAGTPYAHSVPLTWTSTADNFNVRYRTIGTGETQTFFDGFENGLGNWTTIRNGGGSTNTDWQQYSGGHHDITPHSGSYLAMSRSWSNSAYSVDNWLITPQVTLDGTLRFWAAGDANYPEFYEVYISTTGNSINDFSWFFTPPTVTDSWVQVSVDLSSFNGASGYIALRHTDTDKDFLYIDDFGIYAQSYGEWSQLIPVDGTSFTLTGLESQTAYQVEVQANCGDEPSGWSNRVSFTTSASNIAAPTNLTVDVNSITNNSATVSWQGVAANEGHQYYEVYCAESNVTSVPTSPAAPNLIGSITETSYTLTGLYSDTEYHVWVRDYCGEDGYSNWTPYISFTTLESCPRPTNLSYSNVTGHGAIVTWTGSSNGYNVYLGTEGTSSDLVNVNFSNGIPSNWNNDSSYPWTVTNGYIKSGNAGVASSTSIISVTVTFPANGTIEFDAECSGEGTSTFWDHCDFIIDGTTQLNAGANISGWNHYSYEVTAGEHTFTWSYTKDSSVNPDGDYFAIDNVVMTSSSIIWGDPIHTENTEYTFNGLTPETTYFVSVQNDCGDEGLSSMSSPITFTTTIACPAPTNITVSGITGHEATITWNGTSEGYNVFFGTLGPDSNLLNVDFSSGIPSNWSNNSSYPWTATTGYIMSGNAGQASTTSSISVTVTFPVNGTVEFDAQCMGEGTSYDVCKFLIDNTQMFSIGANGEQWDHYTYEVTAGEHTFTWTYTKDSSVNPTGDYFAIDNVVMIASNIVWGDPIYVENTEYTFNGLTAETTYFVKMQSDCGEEGISAESEPVTFITDVTCPAPSVLAATNVTSNSAVLNWNGNAESYNVSYYKTFFFDSFEDDLSQWTIYHEGDPESWEWGIENPHDNSADLNAHSGNYAVVAYSDVDVHADSWLVSPQILFPNQTTLKFWIMRSTYDDAADEYEVRLSTTSNAIEDFDVVLKEKEAANSEWTEVTIDLSQYDGQQGYIAIRHDYTGGFFLMVDDFGIFGWSENIATTDNSLLIEDLLPETEYLWHVQADCGEEGESAWSNVDNFTTLRTCPVPFDLSVSEETAYGATISWTGYSDSYLVAVAEMENISEPVITYDFEDGWQGWTTFQGNTTSPNSWMHNTAYPTSNNDFSTGYGNNSSDGFMLSESYISGSSSGAGTAVTPDNYLVSPQVRLGGSISFYAGARNTDYCAEKFSVMVSTTDNTNPASFTTVGTWTLSLSQAGYTSSPYTVDLSAYSGMGYIAIRHYDCYDQWFLAIDDVTIVQGSVETPWITFEADESPFILNDDTYFLPQTTYQVKVKGICGDEETEYSESITFTTLDESTKIFVIEGDWNDGDNWVPAGVPTMEQDVILRAEATVFDVAEANNITIEGAAALIIEDGGQLKTNANIEATMKKFIIGYGTDYVETNNGYYLMTLPTAAPIAAADAGLMTEESDYDLYSWDRTATDEEWQNNHDGIDLQNGIGFLYANRDDMEMNFTATLRNSNEPVVVTPAYDEVEHGGWNLCGNPFPCEAYITTDAESMTFYRLVDNELMPIEGAIAPLEAFFVKATAAGQTFTISREATRE